MFAAIGIACVSVGLIAVVAALVVAALRLRRLVRAVAELRAHPIFDQVWLGRQKALVRNLAVNAAILKSDVEALIASLLKLAAALEALGAIGDDLSGAIEQLLGSKLPWLRGLLAAPHSPRSF